MIDEGKNDLVRDLTCLAGHHSDAELEHAVCDRQDALTVDGIDYLFLTFCEKFQFDSKYEESVQAMLA